MLPVLVLFAAPRLAMGGDGGSAPGSGRSSTPAEKAADGATWARLLVNAWVPVVALLAVWPRDAVDWARSHLHLVALFVLTLVSAFFGGDQERLMQPAIWAVYPAVAAVLDRRWRRRPVAVGVLLAAGALASAHHITARFPLPSRRLTAALAVLSLMLALGAAVYVRFRPSATDGVGD